MNSTDFDDAIAAVTKCPPITLFINLEMRELHGVVYDRQNHDEIEYFNNLTVAQFEQLMPLADGLRIGDSNTEDLTNSEVNDTLTELGISLRWSK